ncbi:MAG TPA: polysaccharide biosynthesis C-terminal domain-containing protein [Candidatus Aquilonibacter sp.]|nr:polysaccharide biosynthesis C-terminal domain-containing protein [Candidatus Aquilonibacter sp.]
MDTEQQPQSIAVVLTDTTHPCQDPSFVSRCTPLRSKRRVAWVGKGGLAIVDQGTFASSNFLLNVLLARWLSPADYGAFALAYSAFLLILVLHTALLTSPLLVFGSGKHRGDFRKYMGALITAHFLLMLPISAVLVALAFSLGRLYSPAIEHVTFALALAAPVLTLLWLLRRAFYALLRPSCAAAGGMLYFGLLISSAIFFHHFGWLTPVTGMLIMTAGALTVCLLFGIVLRPSFTEGLLALPHVTSDHWQYGKWLIAAAGGAWVSDQIYYVVLPLWTGLSGTGTLKALVNIAMPALQTIAALGTLLVPTLVRHGEFGEPSAFIRTVKLSLSTFFLGCGCYIGLIWELRSQVFHVFYAGKYRASGSWPLLLIGLLTLSQVLPAVLGAALAAIEKPKLVFLATLGGSLTAVIVGLPLAARFGVFGALTGMVLSYLTTGIIMLLLLGRSIGLNGSEKSIA